MIAYFAYKNLFTDEGRFQIFHYKQDKYSADTRPLQL